MEVSFWTDKRVFVTGHTGFKGGWLSLWLQHLGAKAFGYALEPPTVPNLFTEAKIAQGTDGVIADIRDAYKLRKSIIAFRPEIVFHLAAQPLVRRSYAAPLETYETNVVGTANLLEAVRACPSVRAVVVITTDKVYKNREFARPFREDDELGGYDPYSSSKACAELVTASYRDSFFNPKNYDSHRVAVASVRAGNVIGGGDWAEDRIVPDLVRAFAAGRSLHVRNPNSIRPWQHVLEPVGAYLELAQRLVEDGPRFGRAWNIGPDESAARSVRDLVNVAASQWGGEATWESVADNQLHEAKALQLDSSLARRELGWKPLLTFEESVAKTIDWYKQWHSGGDMYRRTMDEIAKYDSARARRAQKSVANASQHE